ncbi:hypothetical protein EV1_034159 [Malus domestica]
MELSESSSAATKKPYGNPSVRIAGDPDYHPFHDGGLVEGRIFAHKSSLDVDLFLDAIKIGVVESKSLDLYDSRIFKRDLEPCSLGGDSLAKGRVCAKA